MTSSDATSESYTIETRVGRVLEARVFRLKTREDADAYARDLATEVRRFLPDQRPVLCADHRPVVIYAQAVADRLVELFTDMNSRLQRVAIVAARSNATLVMQLERLVREAAFPERRVVHAPVDAETHLAPVLDSRERARVSAFLAEYSPASE